MAPGEGFRPNMLKADGGLSATARALKKQRAGNALGRRCGSVNGSAMGAELHRNLRSYALTASRSRLDAALVLLAAQNRPSQRFLGPSLMSGVTWTAERIEQLRQHVVSGLTCSQIAAEIGVTRNAVIGKIHRLGLSPTRPPSALPRSYASREQQPRLPSQRRLLRLVDAQSSRCDAALAFAPVESANRCSLLEIAADACHWPLGDPHAADFAFCGNTAVPGLSYCVGHARMAYRLPVRRRA